jgi:hypothetical protein
MIKTFKEWYDLPEEEKAEELRFLNSKHGIPSDDQEHHTALPAAVIREIMGDANKDFC